MMMRPNKNTFTQKLLAALLSCTAIVSASSATAGVPTIDFSSLTQLKNLISNGQLQNLELTQIKSLEQQQLDALGKAGGLGSLFGSQGLSSLGSQSDFYSNMEKFAFDPCAVNLCQVGDDPVGTTDIDEAREWAMKNLFAGDIITGEEERDLREIRRRGVLNAAVNGVALATITHNDLAGAGGQADSLDEIVAASQDLRGDMRANSAIALATYKVELQKLAMLTSLVEIQGMANINDVDIYHEDGGTKFSDARIDGDYAVDSPTTRIKVTPPKQGSSGGGGLGGALINSLSGDSSVMDILSSNGKIGAQNLPKTIDQLKSDIQTGVLPSISPDKFNMSTIIADTVSVAQASLTKSGSLDLQNSMTMIQSGMSKGGAQGNTTAMLGLATTYASTGGNSTLSAALNTASIAMDSGNTDAALSFANGVLRDLGKTGAQNQFKDFLTSSMAEVESGTRPASSLILDAAAIFASKGSDANQNAANILQFDPAEIGEAFFRDQVAEAMEVISESIGDQKLANVAGTLRNISEADVASLRDAARHAPNGNQRPDGK